MTQQNAAASEEVSATSEELTTQAEQLQATISYFRIDGGAARSANADANASVDHAVSQLKSKAASMRGKDARAAHHVAVGHVAPGPAKSASVKSTTVKKVAATSGKGFALDLNAGGDDEDVESGGRDLIRKGARRALRPP